MIKNINQACFFLTDRCNLGCGYCFYKNKSDQQVLTLSVFENILKYLDIDAETEIILCGGEPLIEPERLKEMIAMIRKLGFANKIIIQTNVSLLNEGLMAYFLQHKVHLEISIEGDEATFNRNRPGVGKFYYEDILQGVKLVLGSKGQFSATMTVHPANAIKLLDNLKYLAAMGLKSIEVCPAFLEVWDAQFSEIFLDQYCRACSWELEEGLNGLIGRDLCRVAQGTWDFLSMPSGKIIPNRLLLFFSEEIRAHFYLMDLGQGSSGQFLPGAKRYFQELQEYVSSHPKCSVRSIGNFNALQAVKTSPGNRYAQRVKHYVDLCERIDKIDHKVLGQFQNN